MYYIRLVYVIINQRTKHLENFMKKVMAKKKKKSV